MIEIDRLGENLSRIEDFKFNEIDQLQMCSYLNLHCNRLQHLQGLPYDRLCNLNELNLSSNDISLISLSELSFLPSLKILDLSANKIQSLLDLPFLPGLEHLLVSYNMIESLIGLDENVPNLIRLDARNNFLTTRQDLSCLLALRNLKELQIGGKLPNEIFKDVREILYIFESCEQIELIDFRTKSSWLADVNHCDESASTPTPRFDQVARMWQTRLILKADSDIAEQRKVADDLEGKKFLKLLNDAKEQHAIEKDRIRDMCKGLHSLSVNALTRRAEKKTKAFIEREFHLTFMIQEKERDMRESERLRVDNEYNLIQQETNAAQECQSLMNENNQLREEIELKQSQNEEYTEKLLLQMRGLCRLRVNAADSKSAGLYRKWQEAEESQRHRVSDEEERKRKYDIEIDCAEAREKQLVEGHMKEMRGIEEEHAVEQDRLRDMCRGLHSLSVHALTQRAEKQYQEQSTKFLSALAEEKSLFEDKLRSFGEDVAESKRAVSALELMSSKREMEEKHKSSNQKKKILMLEGQLQSMRSEVASLRETNNTLTLSDKKSLDLKNEESALIAVLEQKLRESEDDRKRDSIEIEAVLTRKSEEHLVLRDAHITLQSKAEKAVKRLNSVHEAFLKATADNALLVKKMEMANEETAERERTIVELGSCVRNLQAALRKLSLSLSTTQTHTHTPIQTLTDALKTVMSSSVVEGKDTQVRNDAQWSSDKLGVTNEINALHSHHTTTHTVSDSHTKNGSTGNKVVTNAIDCSLPTLSLNESTDFLNRSGFKSEIGTGAKGINRDERNSHTKEISDFNNFVNISSSRGVDEGVLMGEGRLESVEEKEESYGEDTAVGDVQLKYTQLSSKLDFLDNELRLRVVELFDAGHKIAQLTKSEAALQNILKVKECMLSDQNDVIYDLRGKIFDAEKDMENYRNLQSEFDLFFDTSKREQRELTGKLDRKVEKEKQLKAAIKVLEASNAKLRDELGQDEEDSDSEDSSNSSSDSDNGEDGENTEDGGNERPTNLTSSSAMRGIADVDFGEGEVETVSPHRHRGHNVGYTPSPSFNSSSGSANGSGSSGRRGLHSKSISNTPSSPTETETSRAVVPYSLKRQLRGSSRKELKEWVVMLTGKIADSQQIAVNNNADHAVQSHIEDSKGKDRTLLLQSIQQLTAELADCSEMSKETLKQKEIVEQELLLKEREGLRTAQSMVLMKGKLEQLCLKLEMEQERNYMISENFQSEKKHLSRTVRLLQGECVGKDEEVRRLKAVSDQLRMLVASGTLSM